ncbi:MAG: 30S ribosomal protein S19 [Bacteroidota bacterium]
MRKTRGIKPPFVDAYVLEKVEKMVKLEKKAPIRIYSRRSTILPNFVGLNFEIHNGKNFVALYINENMIGYKFGEFIPTRIFKSHSGDKASIKHKGGASTVKQGGATTKKGGKK